ncbi:MAG: DUF488 domain-containing protein [Actinomycetota bacterium]|nr:DUF488 domain-containing protein [Actinomycetota bacterium]
MGVATFFTVGHGTLPAATFVALVRDAGLGAIVDVRRFPGSRHNPQFGKDEIRRSLAGVGVEYRWMPALGGRRKGSPGSPNVALRNPQFRAYADHMSSDEFAAGVTELLGLASTLSLAVMCSEAVWWRCHRRLLADHLVLVTGQSVQHLFHDGRLAEHPITPGARGGDGHVVYDSAPA